MAATLIGRKVGMTRLFDDAGNNVPVTVIAAGPCFVSQIKTDQVRDNGKRDGYWAVQLAFEDVKARNSTMPVIGHDHQAGLTPKRLHREVRLSADDAAGYTLGQELTVEVFKDVRFVDVVGTSKGKGFSGTMKRWGFKGMCASHGTERKHRGPGSISGRSSNRGTGKPKKGFHMSGHMGDRRITVRSVQVVAIDKDRNLVMVKGPVPGANNGILVIREAKRLYKRKVAKVAEAS